MKRGILFTIFLTFSVMFGTAVFGTCAGSDAYKKPDGHYGSKIKFYHKARFILKNRDALELTDKQVKEIETLEISIEKNMITKKAKIDMVSVDIKAAMRESAIDAETINKLVDQKYELKKQKEKALIRAYVKLKSILTKEQTQKMKGLYKKKK